MKLQQLLWLLGIGAFAALAQPTPQPLFRPIPPIETNALAERPDSQVSTVLRSSPMVKRSRLVNVDFTLIGDAAASAFALGRDQPAAPRRRLLLNLFDDVSLTVDVEAVKTSNDGRFLTWTGKIQGQPRSQVIISKTDDASFASVSTDSAFYQVKPVAGAAAAHVVQELNRDAFPKDGPPRPARDPGPRADIGRAADDDGIIDVLVLYSPAAKAAAGGQTAVDLLVQNAEEDANQGYRNSQLSHRVHVVHAQEVDYNESSGFDAALKALADPADGSIDAIHALRDQYGADMVSLLINNDEYCGLAYLMTDLSRDFSNSAFSVVNVNCAVGNHSFAHEMGHNLGADHDRNNNCHGLFPYSCGLQHAPEFRTIMAYPCATGNCPRVNFWSNPNVAYQGINTGILQGDPNAADNASTLRVTAAIAARWRQSVVPTSPTGQRRTFGQR
jgi:hypothetical protein